VSLFCVAVWIVPRTRAALVLAIRDDIVETTRVLESSRRELRGRGKFHRYDTAKKRCFVGKFLRVANKSLATMRNNC
jgi:hypothetical protein